MRFKPAGYFVCKLAIQHSSVLSRTLTLFVVWVTITAIYIKTSFAKNGGTCYYFMSTHNPRNPGIFNIIKSNLPILQGDPKMNSILSNFTIIKSKRQPNSLKRILTKAKFNNESDHEVKRYKRPNCGLCTHLFEGTTFEFNCGRNFYVH